MAGIWRAIGGQLVSANKSKIGARGEMPLPFVPSKTDIFEVEGGVNVNIVSRT